YQRRPGAGSTPAAKGPGGLRSPDFGFHRGPIPGGARLRSVVGPPGSVLGTLTAGIRNPDLVIRLAEGDGPTRRGYGSAPYRRPGHHSPSRSGGWLPRVNRVYGRIAATVAGPIPLTRVSRSSSEANGLPSRSATIRPESVGPRRGRAVSTWRGAVFGSTT